MSLEPTTLLSIPLLRMEYVSFEVELELICGIFQNFQVFHPKYNFWGHTFDRNNQKVWVYYILVVTNSGNNFHQTLSLK